MEEYIVQGKQATTPEYWIANALKKLNLRFIFQYAPFGFSGRRGEYLLDFLVYNPFPIPLEHVEEHWHSGALASDDMFRLAQLAQHFGREVILIYGDETPTEEATYEAVKRRFL